MKITEETMCLFAAFLAAILGILFAIEVKATEMLLSFILAVLLYRHHEP